MDRVVLADAGPIIHLAQIPDGLSWLPRIFGPVALTPAVRAEVLPGRDAPGEEKIATALRTGVFYEISEISSSRQLPRLGRGETSMIHVAVRLVEDGTSCLLIMDDRKGRRVVQGLGYASIGVAGTGAIVALAKQIGLIDSAARVFKELQENGLYVSQDLLDLLLERVGEKSKSDIEGGQRIERSPRSRKPR